MEQKKKWYEINEIKEAEDSKDIGESTIHLREDEPGGYEYDPDPEDEEEEEKEETEGEDEEDEEEERPRDSSGPTEMDGEPDDLPEDEEEAAPKPKSKKGRKGKSNLPSVDDIAAWTKLFNVPYTEALKILDQAYQSIWDESDFPTSSFIPIGTGSFEAWFLGLGKDKSKIPSPKAKITIECVENLDDDQVVSLFTNIFYNQPKVFAKANFERGVLTTIIKRAFEAAAKGVYNGPEDDTEMIASELARGWSIVTKGGNTRF